MTWLRSSGALLFALGVVIGAPRLDRLGAASPSGRAPAGEEAVAGLAPSDPTIRLPGWAATPSAPNQAAPTLRRGTLPVSLPAPDTILILPEALARRLFPPTPTGLAGPGSTSFVAPPDLGPAPLLRPLPPGSVPLPAFGEIPVPRPLPTEEGLPTSELRTLVTEYTDLDVVLRGRAGIGGSWSRFEPCEGGVRIECDPSFLPRFDPNLRFAVRVQGSIQDRILVDVDYDQAREFSEANNINIIYQGLEGEPLRRIELGDVTFRLPDSRFLTRGIPTGNFGIQSTVGSGPFELSAVWAQQDGDLSTREFRLSGTGAQRGFVQTDTLVLDDADYQRGQFFFLVHPTEIERYPHIDVLSLDPSSAPTGLVPGIEPIQLYRYENDRTVSQQVEGYIQAEAVAGLGADTVREAGWFRLLQPGSDYFVHSSGLWVALRFPLQPDELLAATYVTASGDTIGDYNPERIYNEGGRPRLRLLHGTERHHQPGRPTWEMEMHQVYRVSTSEDVEDGSVEVTVSLGELSAGRTFRRGPGGDDITFLQLFGLDEEAPVDKVDAGVLLRPHEESFQLDPAVRGTFLVFPTLRPFAEPPPLPSLGLPPEETAAILGADANPRIYEADDPFERRSGGLFRLTIPYRLRSEEVISSFSLGAIGIREGSERIFVGDRRLERGTDYLIDYQVGQVTLLEPELLFAASHDPVVRASWEQRSFFRPSPVSVFGVNGRYEVSERATIHVLGLFQSEESLVRRPQLGLEPSRIFLGGFNVQLENPAPWFDRALAGIPGLRSGGPSLVRVNGELAVSAPDPNLRGQVYLDDFDGTDDLPLSVLKQEWRHGSAPTTREGAESALPTVLDEGTAADLTWQHNWVIRSEAGDSVGIFDGLIPRQEIDRQINVAGPERREAVLRLTFDGGSEGADPRSWRSITTVLAPTGVDLSKSEFLEVYVAHGNSMTLVFDLGFVSEDAFFVDDAGNTSGVKSETGEPWGLGLLDFEADPREGEIWSNTLDRVGVWDESCLAEPGIIYPLGDPRANCTRGNGRVDHEDLDEDGILDTEERYLRFVVPVAGGSPFLARARVETGTDFRLFRVPLRSALGTNVGDLTEADLRAVKHLRITAIGPNTDSLTLARMRIVGSRWVARGEGGILEGLSGDLPAPTSGRLQVGSVSALTEGNAYQPPPGVLEELDNPQSAIAGEGIEFAERALRIRYEDVPPGGRAEVYHRFPQRPRNFLDYRDARLWVVAREGDWGADEPIYVFLKVGEDRDNFYLFRKRLVPAASPNAVTPNDWLPEARLDFEEWFALRVEAERRLIEDPPSVTGEPLQVWSQDSTYAVFLRDRGRAPNLAQAREISLGVFNGSGEPVRGEVWFNELRLGRAVRNPGVAGAFDVELVGGDALDARLTIEGRGAEFRQREESPTFETGIGVTAEATLQLDRMMPEEWGVRIPLSVSHTSDDLDPVFLFRSDVRAAAIPNIRTRGNQRTRFDLAFAREGESESLLGDLFLDDLVVRAGYSTSTGTTLTSETNGRTFDGSAGYGWAPVSRSFSLLPGALGDLLRFLLPESLEPAEDDAALRWTPTRISVGGSYFRRDSHIFRFDEILEVPGEDRPPGTPTPRETFQTTGELWLQPFRSLTAQLSFVSSRELLSAEETTVDPEVIDLIEEDRTSLLGVDFGWESYRFVRTSLAWNPRIWSWLRTGIRGNTRYVSERNASFVDAGEGASEDLATLPRNVNGQRDLSADLAFVPAEAVRALFGQASQEDGMLARLGGAIDPITVRWTDRIGARYNRDPIRPSTSFQFGLGRRRDFGTIDEIDAVTFTDGSEWTFSSGARLPGGLALTGGYRTGDETVLDTRSDRRVRNRVWPDLGLSWTQIPIPAGFGEILTGAGVSSAIERRVRETSFGAEGLQTRSLEVTTLPTRIRLDWMGGVVTRYDLDLGREEASDPTGRTERDDDQHRISVNTVFAGGTGAGRLLERPLDLAFVFAYDRERSCRTVAGREECVPFIDQVTRRLDLSAATELSDLEVGLTVAYVDQQSFIAPFRGSTRLNFELWGGFTLDITGAR